jgi:hypothetical protein
MHASASSPAASTAGFDAILSSSFQVVERTCFSPAGHVTTGRDLDNPEVVACQYDGTVLVGDSRAAPLAAGIHAFDDEREVFPGETAVVECAAATSGGQSDTDSLSFEFAVNDLDHVPEPGPAACMLAAACALAPRAQQRRSRS